MAEGCRFCGGSKQVWTEDLAGLHEAIACPECIGEETVEHAVLYSDGSMLVRPNWPELEERYPLDQWILANKRHGGKVFRRKVVVVEDWQEVRGG